MITTVVIDEVHNRSAHSDYVLALTLAAMQKTTDLRLVLMSATGDHNLVRERIPYCQQIEQPLDRSANLLNQTAQIAIAITYHIDRAGQPLVEEETCHSKGVNSSNKIMVFLPGLAQIFQFCEILQRALDLGWTEMLILLPFHGQSSTECVEAVFADPAVLAPCGKCPLGQNASIYDPIAFQKNVAPSGFQEIWAAYHDPRYARSCIVCTNVAESGVTIPNVGLAISSGVQSLSEPPKTREEQIPGKSTQKTLVEEVAVSISTCGSNSMRCADQRRFLQTTRGFLTKDIGLMSHILRNPVQGISQQ